MRALQAEKKKGRTIGRVPTFAPAVFWQTSLAGGLFIERPLQHRLFFSGAAGGVHVLGTHLAAPLKSKTELGGVWIYKQATPTEVKTAPGRSAAGCSKMRCARTSDNRSRPASA